MRVISKRYLKIIKYSLLVIFIILMVFIGINLAYIRFSTDVSQYQTDSSDGKIKLMTYNIYSYDLSKVWPVIREANADIYVLQELDFSTFEERPVDAVRWLAFELGYYYFELNNTNMYNGVSILSKWTITSSQYFELPYQEGNLERSLLISKIETPRGILNVFASHLQQPFYQTDQVNQIEKIIDFANGYSDVVFLCDCNTPDLILLESYRKLNENFEDSWIISGHFPGSGRTWPADHPYLRVDYIWIKGGIKVVKDSAHLIGDENNSDHKAVSVEIII
jgi:endonuclease/exonuclease/phosphatase family metal-dependent hydrolase